MVFEPQNINASYAEINDNSAYYKNVWNNVDVELSVLNTGIKEYLIIKNVNTDTVFRYKIISNALFFDNGKGISFVQDGKGIFHIPAPESFDAKGNKIDVLYRIYQESGFYYLEFTVKKGYEYPVVIDPIVVVNDVNKIEDAAIWADMPDSPKGTITFYHFLGNYNSTTYRWNILFRLKNHGIPNDATIDSALLKLYIYQKTPSSGSNNMYVKMYNVRPSRNWVESEVTWNSYKTGSSWTTAGALDTTNDIYGSECVLDTIQWKGVVNDSVFLDITNLMKKWAGKDSIHINQGFMLKRGNYSSDSLRYDFRSKEEPSGYHPSFIIYYNNYLTHDLKPLSEHSIECSIDTTWVGHVDSFVVMRSSDSSAISDVFYTTKDTLDTLSINAQYSLIAGGYKNGTLKYYSNIKSIYTLAKIPISPFVQSWTTKTLRIHPKRGENPSNTNLAIYDSTLHKYISSSGDTITTAVWKTESQWDTVIIKNRNIHSNYSFGTRAKNGNDSITVISGISNCKTNSLIDSVEVKALSDSSYIVYFGNDSVYSPFKGYYVRNDSNGSVVSDTIKTFSYGIKSIVTNYSFPFNTRKRLKIVRIENQKDSLYYSNADSAYTLIKIPTKPIISGTSDSTFKLQFDDISGNPANIKYAVFDSLYSAYRKTTGDTSKTIVFAVDTVWNNLTMKTYSPNLLETIGIFGKNNDSVFSAIVSDTTWTFASVPGMTYASIIDSTRILIKIDPNDNPGYTYFAIEDSISGRFVDINTGNLRSSGVTVDSIWAFGRYTDWGGSNGFTVTVTPKTQYYFRAYSKDGNTVP